MLNVNYDVLSQHITCSDSRVLTGLNSAVKATIHKEALKETNFSEDILSKRPGHLGMEVLKSTRCEECQHVSDSNSWREIGMFMIWCEMFGHFAIGRYVLISYIAVNDPYESADPGRRAQY